MTTQFRYVPKLLFKELWRYRVSLLSWVILTTCLSFFASIYWPFQLKATAIVSTGGGQNYFESQLGGDRGEEFLATFARDLVAGDGPAPLPRGSEILFQYADLISGSPVQVSAIDDKTIRVEVVDSEAAVVVERAHAIANEISNGLFSLAKNEAESQLLFFEQKVSDYRRELRASENRLKLFRQNNLGFFENSNDLVNQKVLEFTQQSIQLSADRARLQSQLDTLRNDLSPDSDFIQQLKTAPKLISSAERHAQEELDVLVSDLNRLRLSYHDTYPAIIEVKQQIAQKQAELNQLKNHQSDNILQHPQLLEKRGVQDQIRTQLLNLDLRIEQVNQQLQQEIKRINELSEADIKLKQITRDYQVTLNEYQALLEQKERQTIALQSLYNRRSIDFSVTSSQQENLQVEGVNKRLVLLLGLVSSLVLPLIVILFRLFLDRRIRLQEQVWQAGIVVLSNLPQHRSTSAQQLISRFGLLAWLLILLALWGGQLFAIWLSGGVQL